MASRQHGNPPPRRSLVARSEPARSASVPLSPSGSVGHSSVGSASVDLAGFDEPEEKTEVASFHPRPSERRDDAQTLHEFDLDPAALDRLRGAMQRKVRSDPPSEGVRTPSAPAVEASLEPLGAGVFAEVASPTAARLGGYALEAELARSSKTAVYRALDPGQGRTVVVRELLDAPDEARARLDRLAPRLLAAARVGHPHVVRPVDVGRDGLRCFVVHGFAPGDSLEAWVAGRGPLSLLRALEVGRDLARGLTAVHAAGVVHGDVRPGRAFLGPDRWVRLAGLGLEPTTDAERFPSLQAPELAWGAAPSPASDVYALAGLLYVALAGALPFDPRDARSLTDALDRQVPSLRIPGLPSDIEALLVSMLDPAPEQRPSAGAVAERLGRAATRVEGQGGAADTATLRLDWARMGARAAAGFLVVLAGALALHGSGGATRWLTVHGGAVVSSSALGFALLLELVRLGELPLAALARLLLRLRDGAALLGCGLLLAGGLGGGAAGLDRAAALGALGAAAAFTFGSALCAEVARARADRGRGRTLAVLGDLRLSLWRRLALPYFAGLCALAGVHAVLRAYFGGP